MSNKDILSKEKLKNLPIGVMATLLGTLTLSNVFAMLGFNSLRHLAVNIGVVIILAGFMKLFLHPKQVFTEMDDTVLGSIYPTFCMSMMLMAAYYVKYNFTLGKSLWLFAVSLNVIVLIIFTYNNLIKKFEINKFLPPYFVPYVGIIVAVITSPAMKAPVITKVIFYFSFIAYFIILPFMIYRLATKPVADLPYPTLCIMAAPPSLCVVAYLTLFKEANVYLTLFVYLIVILCCIYMYTRLPKILRMKFTPSFAGITFPLAISTLATFKVSALMNDIGQATFSNILRELGSLQLILASAGILFVIYNFIKLLIDSFKIEN
ncbi:TDT family transporter [Clostridium septicum]|uniref:TDT family transporter n=1 Tax=Clostridium septicum TaxID=1504 RepID=UPI003216C30D